MDTNKQDRIEEHQATTLLGLSAKELRWFSRACGLGRTEKTDHGEEVVFTYEELRRICQLAAPSDK